MLKGLFLFEVDSISQWSRVKEQIKNSPKGLFLNKGNSSVYVSSIWSAKPNLLILRHRVVRPILRALAISFIFPS